MSVEARVHSLWRYPVKSMAGEELDTAEVIERGLLGDRVYALVYERNKVGTARKLPAILDCRPRFVRPPRVEEADPPEVIITLPDGREISSEQADAAAILSSVFGRDVTLFSSPPEELSLEFAAGTLAGKFAEATEFPLATAAPPGAFVDYATVHLLTTSTLAQLKKEYPEGEFEIRRFRPNIVVETTEAGYVENGWLERTLALGDEVRLKVSIPCPRCVIPTLPQGGLRRDPAILRTIAKHNKLDLGDFGELPCVGVCADVVTPGTVRRGDTVRVLD